MRKSPAVKKFAAAEAGAATDDLLGGLGLANVKIFTNFLAVLARVR